MFRGAFPVHNLRPILIFPRNSLNFTQQPVNDLDVNFRGQWSFSGSSHTSTTAGDNASFQFTGQLVNHGPFFADIYQGTSFQLIGSTSPQAGNYSVQLDNGGKTLFSAKSSFSQPDSLLFFASGLDAEVNHTLEIVNVEGATLVIPTNAASAWALAATFVKS